MESVKGRVRKIVKIDEMQFVLWQERGHLMPYSLFSEKKYLLKNKELWMVLVDLEKALDRVPMMILY